MPLFSSRPVSSPIAPAARLRSSCGLLPTWCGSQEPKKLFSPLLAAIHSEPSPTSPSALPPFSGAKLPIGLGLVGLFSGMLLNRLTTR